MEIFNFETMLDGLIADFPGNRELQAKLGLPLIDGEPIKSIDSIAGALDGTEELSTSTTLVRMAIGHLMDLPNKEPDPDVHRNLADILKYTNRIIMLTMLANAKQEVIPDFPIDLMKACVDSAMPGYRHRLIELVDETLKARSASKEHTETT